MIAVDVSLQKGEPTRVRATHLFLKGSPLEPAIRCHTEQTQAALQSAGTCQNEGPAVEGIKPEPHNCIKDAPLRMG